MIRYNLRRSHREEFLTFGKKNRGGKTEGPDTVLDNLVNCATPAMSVHKLSTPANRSRI